ncbi:bestrophin family protein [Cupriavidus agavae]|uniref:Putative membrane protein n=1 Tax=Cupriavidus agavae TaxID=1001822 RepID=A0A4Q7R8C3_9BURK|nr:bestrophin family ion channel [Cupriavidus agavae]RZT29044.1 putative membrane protein [Cupriavidus agavae]
MHLGKSYSLFEFTVWSRRQIYASLACGSLPVLLYQILDLRWLAIPTPVVVLLGTATSFIVGFRNVQTYGRALEAHQIWTEIVNGSRCLGLMSRDFIGQRTAAREFVLRHCAWLTALRYQLRTPKVWENAGKASNVEYRKYYRVPEWETPLGQALAPYLSAAEIECVLRSPCRATRLLGLQSSALKRLLDAGPLPNGCYMELNSALRSLSNQQGRAERIKDFPYPRQYAVVNKLFVRAFCLLLPFGVLTEFEKLSASVSGAMHGQLIWLVIPFSAMISWMYLALEQVGESTENPFEGNANDVPMAYLCRKIEQEMLDLLDEVGEMPAPAPAAGPAIVL